MILSRHEFRLWLKLRDPSFYSWKSPAWSMETKNIKPHWFVNVRPIRFYRNEHDITKQDYWDWCNKNLSGKLLCYWSDDEEGGTGEWWGFTNKDDITLWLLRWS